MNQITPHHFTPPLLQIVCSKTQYIKAVVEPKVIHHQAMFAEQRKQTLNKYRRYVQDYNDACSTLNKAVFEYNTKVEVFTIQNQLETEAFKANKAFKIQMGNISIYEYNSAAKIENSTSGKPLIKLRIHEPIKKPTEQVFSMILFKYAKQMDEKTAILKRYDATTVRALQKVEINHYELANTVIDSVNTLPYCKKTIQNHVKRLTEAGVLFDYTFKGREKPVNYHVNSQILTVFCCHKKLNLCGENQLFKLKFEKDLHNNEIVTRTFINKKEIIEVVNNQPPSKETESISSILSKMQLSNDNNQNHYKNTNQRKQFETKAAEKSSKISNYLHEKIEDPSELLKDVANGDYDNYRFVNRALLEKEVYGGNLPKEELRNLLLQTFIKIAAPLWKQKNANLGTWTNAWTIIEEEFLLNNNKSIPNKATLLYLFDNLVFRITYAKRYFKKYNQFNILYPSQYFDITRKTSKSGGFAYTIEALKRKQKNEEYQEKRKQKQIAMAQHRNFRNNAIVLVEKKVNQLKNGTISIIQLHDYLTNNAHIPQDIKENLHLYIERGYKC